jgi:hypothetical protein
VGRRPIADEVLALSAAFAAGRAAIGVALLVAPHRALAGLGFGPAAAETITVARLAGGRDLALGVATAIALGDGERLRLANALGAAVDCGDAAIFASLLASGDGAQAAAGRRGLAAALAAAAGGMWAAARLSHESGVIPLMHRRVGFLRGIKSSRERFP